MKPGRVLVVICLTGPLLGCGQKGPLVLPDAAHPHKKITDRARDGKRAAPTPATATAAPASAPTTVPAQPAASAAPPADPATRRQP